MKGKVDRRQLYAEIKLHIVCWENQILADNANPANLDIYYDGSVIDHRWIVNFSAWLLYGGEYE